MGGANTTLGATNEEDEGKDGKDETGAGACVETSSTDISDAGSNARFEPIHKAPLRTHKVNLRIPWVDCLEHIPIKKMSSGQHG